jgi:uncharacterized damage-inducible protein DinB
VQRILSLDKLLRYWEGHRRLTRRTIAAFPEGELFAYKVEPMRSFGEMVREVLEVEPILRGKATGEWEWTSAYDRLSGKVELLAAWDESLATIRGYWPRLSVERLDEVEPDRFFGGPPQANIDRLLYLIDNEIHHRGQGYVYLRRLGIEPPAFYKR